MTTNQDGQYQKLHRRGGEKGPPLRSRCTEEAYQVDIYCHVIPSHQALISFQQSRAFLTSIYKVFV